MEQSTIQPYVDFRVKYHVPIWLGESGENTDMWVSQFARLLEHEGIGWAFWPYKKMDATSSPVSFAQPEHWSEIVAYAKMSRNLGTVEERWKARPSQQVIDAAYSSFLHNIEFGSEHSNDGYIKALLPRGAAVAP